MPKARKEESIEWEKIPQGKVLWIKCRRCKNKWHPRPDAWTDKNSDIKRKTVRCPKCSCYNELPKAVVAYLKRQAQTYVEWGFE